MGQADIELGYIGALVGQLHGETTLDAVKRMMAHGRRAEAKVEMQGARDDDVTEVFVQAEDMIRALLKAAEQVLEEYAAMAGPGLDNLRTAVFHAGGTRFARVPASPARPVVTNTAGLPSHPSLYDASFHRRG